MGKVIINGQVVTLEESLSGVRYWMKVNPQGIVPKFKVYVYVGWCKDTNMFFFRSKVGNIYVVKKAGELEGDSFKPFLMDMKKIEEYINEQTNQK